MKTISSVLLLSMSSSSKRECESGRRKERSDEKGKSNKKEKGEKGSQEEVLKGGQLELGGREHRVAAVKENQGDRER